MDKKQLTILGFCIVLILFPVDFQAQRTFGLAIHGGAGGIQKERLSTEQQQAYEAGLKQALDAGYKVLEDGGTAQAAVIEAITTLENDSLFNAGKGSVLNNVGEAEMDASIMRGDDLNAGAVAGVKQVKNPILAAEKVMDESEHVMFAGSGADSFAVAKGLEQEDPSYFITTSKVKALKSKQEAIKKQNESENDQGTLEEEEMDKHGTVGAVALDKYGNLAAGTSTGGMNNKQHNRVGDSPIIGAGTYANNKSCAVSCTGHGEYYIRLAVAHEVSALMLHKGWDLDKATRYVIHIELADLGGTGGIIAIDRRGNVSMTFNTAGMFRAYRLSNSQELIEMFEE